MPAAPQPPIAGGFIRGSLLLCAALLAAFVQAQEPQDQRPWGIPTLPREMIPEGISAELRGHIEGLYGDDATCRRSFDALSRLGPEAAAAAPFLAGMMAGHGDYWKPNAAKWTLIRIGRAAVPALLPGLTQGGAIRSRTIGALVAIRDERAIEPLLGLLADGWGPWADKGRMDREYRERLGWLRPFGEAGRKRVLEALKSETVERRRAAVHGILAFTGIYSDERTPGDAREVVALLMAALKDEDAKVRAGALESLWVLKSQRNDVALPEAEAFRAALADADAGVRRAAAEALAYTTGEGRVRMLAEALSDRDGAVCAAAIESLALIGGEAALDAVAAAAKSADEAVRARAAGILGLSKQPRHIPTLLGLLDDPATDARVEAAAGLGKLRASQAEARLLAKLDDPAVSVRAAAVLALGRCGGEAAAEALIRLTGSDDAYLRFESALALSERLLTRRGGRNPWVMHDIHRREEQLDGLLPLPRATNDAFPYDRVRDCLERLLAGPDSGAHIAAVDSIVDEEGRLPASPEAVLGALNSGNSHVRYVALGHLARVRWVPDERFLGPLQQTAERDSARVQLWGPALARMGETEYVVKRAIEIARKRDAKVAGMAVSALARLGEPGVEALIGMLPEVRADVRELIVRELAARLDHLPVKEWVRSAAAGADGDMRETALRIVGQAADKIGAVAETTPELLAGAWRQNVSDPDEPARGRLLALGAAATLAVQALLADKDQAARAAAAVLLGEMGDQSAVSALVGALSDLSASVRVHAAEALGALGDRRATGPLMEVLGDDEPAVRESAAAALGALGDPAGVGALVKALEAPEWQVRRTAAESLGAIGGAEAGGALRQALAQDPDGGVRRAAAAALGTGKDEAGVPALIAALGDADGFVRAAAHRTLRSVTKQDLEANAGTWRAWWEGVGKNQEEPRMDTDQH